MNYFTCQIADYVQYGPQDPSNAVCVGCADNTSGPKCEVCQSGFFRLKTEDLTNPCRRYGTLKMSAVM